MGEVLGCRLGAAMAVVERMVETLISSEVPLDRGALTVAAQRLARTEAPFSGPELVDRVVDSMVGLGPAEPLLRDPVVTDILINGANEVWVERNGVLQSTDVRYEDDGAVINAVERVIAPLGLRIDRASPFVDARLSDGSRLHAVIPPAAPSHPIVAIRRFTQAIATIDELVAAGSATESDVRLLKEAVVVGKNILVSGGTGAGKTTLLNLIGAEIPDGERVVTIEDAAELSIPGHVVSLEGRPSNAEGMGRISLRDLLRSALRLRPDRIVVGEVRGSEALDMVWALNTGHRGSLSTIHANGPDEALWRLETLALLDGAASAEAVKRQIHSAIDLVVQVERNGGYRRIVSIDETGGALE
ncbi:MAG: CpaF family protein [Acidimicrobiia bacterium]|nr:CpaF family protein [Acidimicrobiia bacterium]